MSKIVENTPYKLKNGMTVKFKRNKLPHYCFSVVETDDLSYPDCKEVFDSDGVGYHDDCGFVVDFNAQ